MEILKADPEYKRKILKIQGLFVVGVAALIHWGLPAFKTFIHSKKPEEGIHILLWVLVLLFSQFVFFGIYIVRKGKKVLAAGQFPLSGTKVFRDTTILRGEKAQYRAKLMIGGGIVIGVLSLYGAIHYPWALHKEFHRSPAEKSNNGRQQDSAKKPALPLRP